MSVSKNKISGSKDLIHLAIMLIIMAVFFYLPPFSEQLTNIGMRLLGIFIASCYGWCTVGLFWPTLLCLCLLPFTGAATITEILSAGLGNFVCLLVILTFMLCNMINKSGAAVFLANWIVSRSFLQGKPWLIVAAFGIGSCIVGGMGVNIFITMFVFWSIVIGACEAVGYTKGSKEVSMLLTVVTCGALMGYSIMPFNGIAVILLTAFSSISGESISYAQYLSFSIPMAFGTVILMIVFLKIFSRKLDMVKLANYDVTSVDPEKLKLSTEGKIVLIDLLIFVLIALISGLVDANNPIAFFVNKIGIAGLLAICMLPLLFIKIDGEVIWKPSETFRDGVQVDVIIVLSFILPLGTYMSNNNTGIAAWVLALVNPILEHLTPFTIALFIIIISLILTQFMTNMIVAYMFFPVIMALSQQLGFEPWTQALLAIFICHIAILLPSACTYAALTFAHEWSDGNVIRRSGFAFVLAGFLMTIFGYFYINSFLF